MIPFREHTTGTIAQVHSEEGKAPSDILFKGKSDKPCVRFFIDGVQLKADFSYYVGADWISSERTEYLYVQSKLNTKFNENTGEELPVPEKDLIQIDVIKMLFDALSEKETLNHTNDLFEIKFDKPFIKLNRSEDLLSPILILQYLMVVRGNEHKGL